MPARVTCPDCSAGLHYGGIGLLHCYGCGGYFSTSTGSRLTRQHLRRRDLWVIGSTVAAVALFVAFAGTALVLSLDEAATSLATLLPAPPPALPPVVDADLAELLDKFQDNPIAVFEKYRGKAVRITCRVRAVDIHFRKRVHVAVAPEEADPNGAFAPTALVFLPNPALVRQMKDYPLRSRITLTARIDEMAQPLRFTALAITRP
jgi:hypothetical protein